MKVWHHVEEEEEEEARAKPGEAGANHRRAAHTGMNHVCRQTTAAAAARSSVHRCAFDMHQQHAINISGPG